MSALLALAPFIYIWKSVAEIVRVLPDLSRATELLDDGMETLIATRCSMLIYFFVALMCCHVAAFRVARNLHSRAIHRLVDVPLGFFASGRHASGRLCRASDESAAQTERQAWA